MCTYYTIFYFVLWRGTPDPKEFSKIGCVKETQVEKRKKNETSETKRFLFVHSHMTYYEFLLLVFFYLLNHTEIILFTLITSILSEKDIFYGIPKSLTIQPSLFV